MGTAMEQRFSETMRALARDARRLLEQDDADPRELARLLGRIRRLRSELPAKADSPLVGWLDELSRQVECSGYGCIAV
jgi:hypothetical protein